MKNTALLLIAMISLAGCSRNTSTTQADRTAGAEPGAAQSATSPEPAQQGSEGGPELLPSHTGTGHDANGSTVAPANIKLTGQVLESLNSSGFSYLHLKTSTGEQWAAVKEMVVKNGATVTVIGTMSADNFEAKSINKTFDHIVFGSVEGSGGTEAAPQAAAGGGNPHAGMSMPPSGPADTAPIHVQKAEGADGRTVAEMWANKTALKDKHVAVRGKVVKFLPGIMGKNWLHLRDGSGSREKGDDDLTVTTSEMATIGDIVLVEGTARLGKDFGAGYSYPLMVEDATIKK